MLKIEDDNFINNLFNLENNNNKNTSIGLDFSEIENSLEYFYQKIKYLVEKIPQKEIKEIKENNPDDFNRICNKGHIQKMRKFSAQETFTSSCGGNLCENNNNLKYMPVDKLFNNEDLSNDLINNLMDKSNSTNVSPIILKSMGSQVRTCNTRSKRLKFIFIESCTNKNQETKNAPTSEKNKLKNAMKKLKLNNQNSSDMNKFNNDKDGGVSTPNFNNRDEKKLNFTKFNLNNDNDDSDEDSNSSDNNLKLGNMLSFGSKKN